MPEVVCSVCKKKFNRGVRRINESKKKHWKCYCSSSCWGKAKNKQLICRCSRPGCNKSFERTRNQFKKSKDHYCSLKCAAIVNNKKFPKRIAEIKRCEYCGKKFKMREKYCSKACKDKSMIVTEKKILDLIKNFVVRNNRIPLKREFTHCDAARERFGTWNKAIEAAGFVPNSVLFAKKCYANDGHKCDSVSEKIIDDWMYARKISHEINVRYPGDIRFTVDFKVGSWWIEFFGLAGDLKEYDRLKRKKLGLIKKEKLNLVEIYPCDLFPKGKLEEKLGFLVE